MKQKAALHPAHWFDHKRGAIFVIVVALVVAYVVGARALFTGSLQQYGLALASLTLAADRLIDVFCHKPKRSQP